MSAAVMVETQESESVFKPALLLMSGRTLAFAATFFIPVVLARIFDPAEFGTYKQLFLVHSTIYCIAQLGMASSLYYFLPRAPHEAGRYAANSMCFLGMAGLAALGLIVMATPKLAQWMSNSALTAYLPWIGLYLFLIMLSTTLEIVLISRSRYLWASASYAISDLARAAAFILPVLVFRQLSWLLWGAIAVAFVRVIVTLSYFRREFGSTFTPDRVLLKSQLVYALPFAAAVLVETLQASFPQYAVSYLFDPATFAIFAVGCLQIPLVDFAASPTSDVMMVKMQERLAEGRTLAVLTIWHDTTWKLALLFFPLFAFCMVAAREIIVFLFTAKYAASAPIFMTWSTVILFTTFQVDGVMRVFAQTWFLLALNVMRLAIIVGLIKWSLSQFHLVGPVLVIALATLVFKAAALARMKTLLQISAARLLPWRSLAALLCTVAGAAAAAFAVKSQIHVSAVLLLLAMGTTFMFTYAALVWQFDLLLGDEKLALTGWVRKAALTIARTFGFRKGIA
ncbi:MAG TPA: oligosaccharide flippase family protein [Bryobacteraceae bacterium]|nr:oligosaccharide flippase family protein [Bryobacteraceae bacterium]HXJ44257.1 oligosaccharide flippase family protein [Bryobacteraceae bacterium]